ncbi:hypothetical protein SAMD00019534_024270 [Acytostelium subglobosum LB1]|uniref:hypothetical protein n=1 Tax=Acytostelium subglobosum LB1 TaxID=1410327 RepID=UPI000644E320|nr:hypothetical protein SAMD00019534_024270 [Acytostelium subglobosum LB1]GAM19252.1 hypothetical protein SAMD00019534_024270 [Acytostelium subglobosum LB1]|eukprot:XP_012757179.1 hypothetical protein SAMD00019534_024270 [Acytostelium subglobosum LB1]
MIMSHTNNGKPHLEGWLDKQGEKGLYRSWKTRYFKLAGNLYELHYYEQAPADRSHSLSKVVTQYSLGFIDLRQVEGTKITDAATFTFSIDIPNRSYILKAKSESDMQYWIQGVDNVLNYHRTLSDQMANNSNTTLLLESTIQIKDQELNKLNETVEAQRKQINQMTIRQQKDEFDLQSLNEKLDLSRKELELARREALVANGQGLERLAAEISELRNREQATITEKDAVIRQLEQDLLSKVGELGDKAREAESLLMEQQNSKDRESQLNARLSESQQELDTLRQQSSMIKKEAEDKEGRLIKDLEERDVEIQKLRDDMLKKTNEIRSRVQEKDAALDQAQLEVATYKSMVKELEDKASSLHKEIGNLMVVMKETCSQSEDTVSQLSAQLTNKHEQLENMEKEAHQKDTEMQQFQQTIESLKKSLDEERSKLDMHSGSLQQIDQEKTKEIARLQENSDNQIKELEAETTRMREALRQNELEITGLRKDQVDINILKQQLEESGERIESLNGEVQSKETSFRERIQELTRINEEQKATIDQLEHANETTNSQSNKETMVLRAEIDVLKGEISSLNTINESRTSELEGLRSIISEKDMELTKLSTLVEEHNKDGGAHGIEIEGLKATIERMEKEREEQFGKMIKEHEQTLVQKEEELAKLRAESNANSLILERMKDETKDKETLQVASDQLSAEVDSLRIQCRALEHQCSEIESIKEQLSTMTQSKETLDIKLDTVQQQVSSLNEELAKSRITSQQLETSNAQLKDDKDRLQAENNNLVSSKSDVDSEAVDAMAERIESLNQQLKNVQDNYEVLQSERDTMEKTCRDHLANINTVTQQTEEQVHKIKKLESDNQTLLQTNEALGKQCNTLLDRIKQLESTEISATDIDRLKELHFLTVAKSIKLQVATLGWEFKGNVYEMYEEFKRLPKMRFEEWPIWIAKQLESNKVPM